MTTGGGETLSNVSGDTTSPGGNPLRAHIADLANPHRTSLFNLIDTDIGTPVDQSIIVFDSASGNWEARPNTSGLAIDPFPYKGAGDPILLIFTGQSNAGDIFVSRVPLVYNPDVYVWGTDGIRTPGTGTVTEVSPGVWEWVIRPTQDATKFAWRQFDPNADTFVIFPEEFPNALGDFAGGNGGTAADGYVGLTRGGGGSAAWGAANALQKATGRPVYVVNIMRSGTPISWWEPGGAVRALYDAQVAAALAALQVTYPNVTFADIRGWMQGENDASAGTAPVAYAESWTEFRDHSDSIVGNVHFTRDFIFDITYQRPAHQGWYGLRYALQKTENRTVMLSSWNKELVDTVHFHGDGMVKYGEEAALVALTIYDPVLDTPPSFVPNDGSKAITATLMVNDGSSTPPARPSASGFDRGYWTTDGTDGFSITNSESFFSTIELGSIGVGDTITMTQNNDANKWVTHTVDVAGVYDPTPAGPLDTGWWYFETTISATGPSGSPDAAAFCSLSTSAVYSLPFTDLLSSNPGGRIAVGYNQGDVLPNSQLSIKITDGVPKAFNFETSTGHAFSSIIEPISGAATFTATSVIALQAGGGKLQIQLQDATTTQAKTAFNILSRNDNNPLAFIGGDGLVGITTQMPSDDFQVVVCPQILDTSKVNQGITLWSNTPTAIGRYSFSDPTDSTNDLGGMRWKHSNDRLALLNLSPSTSNEKYVTIDGDFIGLGIDDTAADSAAWGLYVTPTKGNGVTLTATVAAQHLTPTMPLILQGNQVRTNVLAGTGVRSVFADSLGNFQSSHIRHYPKVEHQSTNATPAFAGNVINIGDGSRVHFEIVVSANRQGATAGTFCKRMVCTGSKDAGVATLSTVTTLSTSSTGTGSTLTALFIAGGGNFLFLATGNASETWDWDFYVDQVSIV